MLHLIHTSGVYKVCSLSCLVCYFDVIPWFMFICEASICKFYICKMLRVMWMYIIFLMKHVFTPFVQRKCNHDASKRMSDRRFEIDPLIFLGVAFLTYISTCWHITFLFPLLFDSMSWIPWTIWGQIQDCFIISSEKLKRGWTLTNTTLVGSA